MAKLKLSPFTETLLIALAGAIWLLVYTRHSGTGISPDSIVYLSTAQNLSAHAALVDYNFKPLVDFPAGYPVFLAMVSGPFAGSLLELAPFLNALLLTAAIIVFGSLLSTFRYAEPWYRRILLLIAAFSPALLEVFSMLWSETLFILLSLLFLRQLRLYLAAGHRKHLWICALLAGVSCVVRYAGITLVGTGLLMILCMRLPDLRKKTIHFFVFASVSLLPLLLNLLHNFLRKGLLTGPRQAGITPLAENIRLYGGVVWSWLNLPQGQVMLLLPVVCLIFLFVALAFYRSCLQQARYCSAENCFRAFLIVYTVFIIGISTLSHFEQLNNRLLSPVYLPLLACLTCGIPGWVQYNTGRKKLVFAGIACLLPVFGYAQWSQLKLMYAEAEGYGIPGYTDDSWKNSGTAAFLREHPEAFNGHVPVYANAHEAAFFNGHVRAESIPHAVDTKDISNFFAAKTMYLIWFDQITDTELISLQQIRQKAVLKCIRKFNDGEIYSVVRR